MPSGEFQYADQRMYASSYGRFDTPDPTFKSMSTGNPTSWNRYWYAAGDPINVNDPRGLCAVMIAGITMAPGSNADWTQEAQNLGADTAYPYQGEGHIGSIVSVIQQRYASNASTFAAYEAITRAIAGNGGVPVDIVAYSGGAAAFSAAWKQLTPWQQSMVGQILYIAPGTAGAPLANNDNVTVETGSGLANGLAGFGTSAPPGASSISTDCLHTQLNCFFDSAGSALAQIQANGPCSFPEVYTRTNPSGVPGVGVPAPTPPPTAPPMGWWWWMGPPPVDDPNCYINGCSVWGGSAIGNN